MERQHVADDMNMITTGIMLKNLQLSVELMPQELKLNDDLVSKIYLPGSKCEALWLGVHLILLYFIRILF